MFWKKKKPAGDPISIPGPLEYREAFRYSFSGDKNPTTAFKGRQVELLNISAGGIAFKNKGFSKYDADRVCLDLSIPGHHPGAFFYTQARILMITPNSTCHCIFENCDIKDYELVHKYVLELQKRDLSRE